MAIKFLKRNIDFLRHLCAPYASILMIRQQHNYRFGMLQVRNRDHSPRTILSYDTLIRWVDLGILARTLAPQERYEITPMGRGIVADHDEPEPQAARSKWDEYGALARKAMGR